MEADYIFTQSPETGDQWPLDDVTFRTPGAAYLCKDSFVFRSSQVYYGLKKRQIIGDGIIFGVCLKNGWGCRWV